MGRRSPGSLYVFVDKSDGVYALIAVEESSVDGLASRLARVRHFRKLRKREKKGYIEAFPRRFQAVQKLLVHVRVFTDPGKLKHFLQSIAGRVKVLCIDDEAYGYLAARRGLSFEERDIQVVRESRIKHQPQKIQNRLRRPMLLADNLANYGRLMLERGSFRNVKKLEK